MPDSLSSSSYSGGVSRRHGAEGFHHQPFNPLNPLGNTHGGGYNPLNMPFNNPAHMPNFGMGMPPAGGIGQHNMLGAMPNIHTPVPPKYKAYKPHKPLKVAAENATPEEHAKIAEENKVIKEENEKIDQENEPIKQENESIHMQHLAAQEQHKAQLAQIFTSTHTNIQQGINNQIQASLQALVQFNQNISSIIARSV